MYKYVQNERDMTNSGAHRRVEMLMYTTYYRIKLLSGVSGLDEMRIKPL